MDCKERRSCNLAHDDAVDRLLLRLQQFRFAGGLLS